MKSLASGTEEAGRGWFSPTVQLLHSAKTSNDELFNVQADGGTSVLVCAKNSLHP